MSSFGSGYGAACRHHVPRSTVCGSQLAVSSSAVRPPSRSASRARATFGIALAGNLPFLSSAAPRSGAAWRRRRTARLAGGVGDAGDATGRGRAARRRAPRGRCFLMGGGSCRVGVRDVDGGGGDRAVAPAQADAQRRAGERGEQDDAVEVAARSARARRRGSATAACDCSGAASSSRFSSNTRIDGAAGRDRPREARRRAAAASRAASRGAAGAAAAAARRRGGGGGTRRDRRGAGVARRRSRSPARVAGGGRRRRRDRRRARRRGRRRGRGGAAAARAPARPGAKRVGSSGRVPHGRWTRAGQHGDLGRVGEPAGLDRDRRLARVERAEQARAAVGDDLVVGADQRLAQVRRGRVLARRSRRCRGPRSVNSNSGAIRVAQPDRRTARPGSACTGRRRRLRVAAAERRRPSGRRPPGAGRGPGTATGGCGAAACRRPPAATGRRRPGSAARRPARGWSPGRARRRRSRRAAGRRRRTAASGPVAARCASGER